VIETIHVLDIAGTAGVIAIVDLRLLGMLFSQSEVPEVLSPLVKVAWFGFALMAASGLLLFGAEAADLYANPAFRWKMLAIIALGLNQWIFHTGGPRVLAAVLSLGLWLTVIVLGRAIAYVS